MLVNLCIIEKNRLKKLQKTVTVLTAIITTQLQLLVGIFRPTLKVAEAVEVVEAVIIIATIEKEEFLTVYQLAEQTRPTSPTLATIARIPTLIARK